MMKKPFPKQGLPLLALAIALTGCPALDTATRQDPQPDPQPTATAPTDEKQEEQKPDFTIKALGPVKATLQGEISVSPGPATVFLSYSNSGWLYGVGQLGYLLPVGESTPSTPLRHLKETAEGHFEVIEAASASHRFYAVITKDYRHSLSYTLGGASPTATTDSPSGNSGYLRLDFAATGPTFEARVPEGSSLVFENYVNASRLSYSPTYTMRDNLDGMRSATLTMTVSVRELDGTPSSGLGSSNFQISKASGERHTLQATETAPGVYRVVATLEGLYGPFMRPMQRMLTVTHSSITHTHHEEVN